MVPPFDEQALLRTFGAMVRAARVARGLTQQETADEAGVSRAQLALLEKGRNVSLLFLLKVARRLDLSVQVAAAPAGFDVIRILELLDGVGKNIEALQSMAIDSALPVSSGENSGDAEALRAFVLQHSRDSDSVARLAAAILDRREPSPSPRSARPAQPTQSTTRAIRRRKK